MQSPHTYPLGRAVFTEIREGGLLYVDKTRYIWQMTHLGGKYVFLSRPRRFGKTLLVSTLEAYFEGREDLFQGLAVHELRQDWTPVPVLRFDLSAIKTTSANDLRSGLAYALRPYEERYGCAPTTSNLGVRVEEIISRAYAQAQTQVALLVDEYDSPLLNVLHDAEQVQEFRDVMREFYSPLKKCEGMLSFVFLTGITKFSQLSIFSELNSLINISMVPQFAGICGITQEELEGSMTPDVEWLASQLGTTRDDALAALKAHYDGYHFAKVSPDVYNPYSLLHALAFADLGNYWFESGTPTSLVNVLTHYDLYIPTLEDFQAEAASFDAPTERMASPVPLMYQGGYLTIKGYDPLLDLYTLGVPNGEVSQGLYQVLLPHYAGISDLTRDAFVAKFATALYREDLQTALQQLRSLLAAVPYDLAPKDEKAFQAQLFIIFKVVGAKVATEVRTSTGRIDVVITMPKTIYVMELKYNKTAREALEQIDSKGYLVPYQGGNKRVVKVGLNYSPDERTIDDWQIEKS